MRSLVLRLQDDEPAVEGVTPALTQARKDLQQFPPFKSYKVLDSTLVLGALGGTTRTDRRAGQTDVRGERPRRV